MYHIERMCTILRRVYIMLRERESERVCVCDHLPRGLLHRELFAGSQPKDKPTGKEEGGGGEEEEEGGGGGGEGGEEEEEGGGGVRVCVRVRWDINLGE